MQEIPVILFGVGGVGQALVRQIIEHRALHAIQFGLQLQVEAICDSQGAVVNTGHELTDDSVQEILAWKASGKALADHALGGSQADLASIVDIAGRSGAIVVDCTASDATVPAFFFALDRGYKIALANKKPLTIQQEVYDRLTRAGATDDQGPVRRPTSTRWEATVGAGLPAIATLNRLFASGDEVARIAGAFSGTLGYVMTGLQAGQSFSDIVREAHRLGYTEPDPRDDLGGIDVARKALILARGLGWQLELNDVEVVGLYPESMADLSVPDFLDALPQLDAEFAERVQVAKAQGKVLRYAATVADGRCSVGPLVVEAGTPLGRLQGTDNLVEFTTRWYQPNPLVIQGRGAGVDATAAGVLSDIIELAFTKD
ncbi:MAG: homoserine dehydrogenase [Caldilineaceae bacterium]|nr:homoserine dehydrogenase [Caldilineaceae bacterium]